MGRAPCCDKVGLRKGRWTSAEDRILINYITQNGEGSWRSLPKNAGLLRCGKSCRLRWINYLRSDLKRGNFTSQEEDIIIKLHASLGNKWSLIANQLPGRTDNEIKNYWNSTLSRRIDTFRRPNIVPAGVFPQVLIISNLAAPPVVAGQQAASVDEVTVKNRRDKTRSRAVTKKNKSSTNGRSNNAQQTKQKTHANDECKPIHYSIMSSCSSLTPPCHSYSSSCLTACVGSSSSSVLTFPQITTPTEEQEGLKLPQAETESRSLESIVLDSLLITGQNDRKRPPLIQLGDDELVSLDVCYEGLNIDLSTVDGTVNFDDELVEVDHDEPCGVVLGSSNSISNINSINVGKGYKEMTIESMLDAPKEGADLGDDNTQMSAGFEDCAPAGGGDCDWQNMADEQADANQLK